jgi:hypothetical protein
VVAANLAGFDELMRPFQNRLIRDEGKNGAAPVADGIEVAIRLEGSH